MLPRHKNIHTIIMLLLLIGGVEAALLSLSDWQFHRYHQRLAERAAQTTAVPITLTGTFQAAQTFALDNQPSPQSAAPGWRVLTPFTTASTTFIVDRGWLLPADRLTTQPDFSRYPLPVTSISVTGIFQPIIPAHGWLRGPLTTTSPHILSRLEPTVLTSGTAAAPLDTTRLLQLTQLLPSQSANLLSQPSPTPDPLRHLSYMLQWLAMALIFPLLCFFAIRRKN